MAGRRLAGAGAALLLVVLVGCGKKAATSAPDSAPPPAGGGPGVGPGPLTKGTKGKKDDVKPDFDTLLSEMKLTAGKPKTDVRPSGQTVLARFTKEFPPTHERRDEAYEALTETAGKLDVAERQQYLWWATKYAGKENVADLLDMARTYAADVKTSSTTHAAFDRLAELKEPSTFEPIAAMLGDKVGLLRLASAKALRAIGSPAEKAVQAYAAPTGPAGKPNEFVVRTVAVQILGDVGTAESLPLLQSLFNDPNSTVANHAKTAAAAIQARK